MLIYDRAGAFRSELMRRVCELSGTALNFSVAYHPWSHGLVERTQQILLKIIKAYVQDFGKGWEDALPYILCIYRSALQEELGRISPSEVVYGKNLHGPLDLLRADWEGIIQSSSVPLVYNLQIRLKAIQETAKENIQQVQETQFLSQH